MSQKTVAVVANTIGIDTGKNGSMMISTVASGLRTSPSPA
jgi:hypothetical protein